MIYKNSFYFPFPFSLAADIEEACFYDDYFMGKELKTIKCLGCGHIKAGPVLETSIILVPIPRGMEDMNDYDWIIEVNKIIHLFNDCLLECFYISNAINVVFFSFRRV